MKRIAAPRHLSAASKKWFRKVVAEYQLEDHHTRLLTAACEAWDRMVQAREVISREGMTYSDRFGQPRKRPEIAIEENARIAFARLIRELCLDSEPTESRPPRLRV